MNDKPKLVDYSLIHKKPKVIQKPKIEIKNINNSFIINFIGFLILCIGGLVLYLRLIKKETNELDKQNIIIGFHQYVKDNIK
tara:strand:+ start:709 stop:954 length:246 start_codon:yes stop_codon:yes gene_type:complete